MSLSMILGLPLNDIAFKPGKELLWSSGFVCVLVTCLYGLLCKNNSTGKEGWAKSGKVGIGQRCTYIPSRSPFAGLQCLPPNNPIWLKIWKLPAVQSTQRKHLNLLIRTSKVLFPPLLVPIFTWRCPRYPWDFTTLASLPTRFVSYMCNVEAYYSKYKK